MKRILFAAVLAASLLLCACGANDNSPFTNPGDSLGGGGTVENVPSATLSQNAANAAAAVGELPSDPGFPGGRH